MAYELKQQLKLSQQLVMTPQLQQAIKLLQLSRLELVDLLKQEINENPVLDEVIEDGEKEEKVTDDELSPGLSASPEDVPETDTKPEFDWKDYLDNSPKPSGMNYNREDREPFDTIIPQKTTLADHLTWQLRLQKITEKELEAGEYIIGNLDKDGYLITTVDEIAQATGVDVALVEKTLKRVQKFDPVGVASRNLQECLLLQVETLPGDHSLVEIILREHMSSLESRKFHIIAKNLKISLKEVMEASHIIANMEPRPGRAFNSNETQYITPDLYVYKVNDEYVVLLNEDGQPKLRINSFYKKALLDQDIHSEKAKEYIQEKLRSAVWLIKSIYHRQGTLQRVMKSIIKFQRDFFDHGIGHLKPLVLRDVAEDIGMHESNISRVTTNKYVHTPHGILGLKYFFNSGLASDDGESIASESVKNKIAEILQKEDPRKPYSDQDIALKLKAQGINIARRTVTKYREMMGILSSSKRKNLI